MIKKMMKAIENSLERIQKMLNRMNDEIKFVEDVNHMIALRFASTSILVKDVDNVLEDQRLSADSIPVPRNDHKRSRRIKSFIESIKIKRMRRFAKKIRMKSEETNV